MLRLCRVYVQKSRSILNLVALVAVVNENVSWPDINVAATTLTRKVVASYDTPRSSTNYDSSKNISDLAKSYIRGEARYGVTEDNNFEFRLRIFNECCKKNSVDLADKGLSF